MARALLSRALPEHLRADVIGDLDEEFRVLAAGRSGAVTRARRWYRLQVLRSLAPAVSCRIREWRASRRARRTRPAPEPIADFLRNLRLAARSLARTPHFTGLALLMLVIGIGTSAAAFTVVDAVLLRRLPYPDAERIVYLYGSELEKENLAQVEGSLFSFTEVAVHGLVDMDVDYGDGVTRTATMPVSADFFRILGSTPEHGRLFAPSDFAAAAPPVAVITEGLAVRHFGGAESAVGGTLVVGGRRFTVIGVMAPGFRYERHPSAEVWFPALHSTDRARSVIARLADGVTTEAARSEAVRIARTIDGNGRTAAQDANVDVQSLPDSVVAFSRGRIQLVVAVATLVFVVACANVANLFLARNTRRTRELSIRSALGAHRRQLIGQLVLEGAVLATLAAFFGTVLGMWATRALIAIQPARLPGADLVSLNGRVLGFAASLSGLTVFLLGALPVAAVPRAALVLRGDRGDVPPRWLRIRDGLVIAQVLTSTVMFIASALFLRSYERLVPADPGFEWRHRLAMRVELPAAGYEDAGVREAFFDRLRRDLANLPGVLSVSGASDLPLTESHFSVAVPTPSGSVSDAPMVLLRAATPNYLQSMGIRVLRGRGIEEADRSDGAPVAVINESMARYLWPDGDPLGRHFAMRTGTRDNVRLEVVGVIGDAWLSARRGGSRPEVFVPYAQERGSALGIVIHARNPERLSAVSVEVARRLEPRAPVVGPNRERDGPASLESVVADALAPWRYQAWLVATFATLAVLLTAGGMYGVLTFDVSRRSHEMGVRLALGARPGAVAGLVVRKGMRLVGAGLAAGVLVAFGAEGALSAFLFGVSALDPISYLAAGAVVSAVGLAATWVPARRATQADPLRALRHE